MAHDKTKPQITVAELRDAFTYDAGSGLFYWRNPAKPGVAKAGELAGSKKPHGYIELTLRQRSILAHRAAWAIVHGEMPKKMIDHINWCRSDNRIENLRLADHAENMWNHKGRASVSGVGKDGSKFYALIRYRGKRLYLGSFQTEDEAKDAYQSAAKEMRGEFHA